MSISYLIKNGADGWMVATFDTYDSTNERYMLFINAWDMVQYPPQKVLFHNVSRAGIDGLSMLPAAASLSISAVGSGAATDVVIGGVATTLPAQLTLSCFDTVINPSTGVGVTGVLTLNPASLTYMPHGTTFTAGVDYGYRVSITAKAPPGNGRPSAWLTFKVAKTASAETSIPLFITLT